MKKIPSLFLRDWKGNKSLVTQEPNPECQWVFNCEGIPTRKWDGTACMVRKGILYKRYDAKFDKKKGIWKPKPEGFEPCQEPDEITGHQPGWIPVDFSKKEDKWFKMAWELIDNSPNYQSNPKEIDGTYELCGITINGNPDKLNGLYFIKHGENIITKLRRAYKPSYITLKVFFESDDGNIEGIVWHHEDGRMAKIKRSDFGLEWGK